MANKPLSKTLKGLQKQGFIIKAGKKHWKIYNPEGHLVGVAPFGNNRDKVPGGSDKVIRKLMR